MIDFNQTADIVAPQLLGAVLQRGPVAIQITEVEAYLGEADPASHAFIGPTARNSVMFGPPGHLYVYASYGIHRAGNLVCSPEGIAGGVLLRAGRVLSGLDVVRARRGAKAPAVGLARGPGNLGKSLGLDLGCNGSPVTQADAPAALDPSELALRDESIFTLYTAAPPTDVLVGPRIGITKNSAAPLRFWLPNEPSVSPPRRR